MLIQIQVEEGIIVHEEKKLEGPLSPFGRYGAQVPQGCSMGPKLPNFWSRIFSHIPSADMNLGNLDEYLGRHGNKFKRFFKN